ncbi:MAG: glucosamine inositolphosphorylceramide transferase family protein [Methyloceanibacter sp.]
MKALKAGLLVDGTFSNKYVYELALWAKDQPSIDISHLIVQFFHLNSKRGGIANGGLKQGLYDLLSKISFRLVTSFERLLLRLSRLYADHYQLYDLSKIVGGIVAIAPVDLDSGSAYQGSVENIETIRALGLDLLIQCGSINPPGDILHASRLGVICLGQADSHSIPGTAAGFWECYYEWSQTAFNIYRLTDETGAGEVLVRGSFRTRYYFSLNQAQLCKKAYAHLRNLLSQIALSGKLPGEKNTPDVYSDVHFNVKNFPRIHQSIAYGIKLVRRILIKTIRKLLRLEERWGISFLSGNWDKLEFSRSTEATLPRGRFWADPFLWSYGGKTFCFVEDFVYKTNKAHITALELTGTKVVEHGIALQEPFHLSFPFLFQYKGDLYMCPESAHSRQIRVYRCAQFPLNWVLHRVVMDHVSAVDTMFFEKGGKWWMLTSIDQSETREYGSELYLFSANSPLETAWVPHPQNPLKIDARGGRNAGLIMDGGKLFRVGQRQGFDRYGEGLLVYEIKAVSDWTFIEDLVTEINPTFRKGLIGTHHLASDGKTTVIDHLSYSFVF